MGGSIPGLANVGSFFQGLGGALGGGGGGSGGGGGGPNPNNPTQPNQQQYNFLTDPTVMGQFAMDQGQNPPQQQPTIPPTPTFSDTNFFSPQQTMPYSGPQSRQSASNPYATPVTPPSAAIQNDPATGWPLPPSTPPEQTPAQPPAQQPPQQQQPGPAGYYGGGSPEPTGTPAPSPTEIAPPTPMPRPRPAGAPQAPGATGRTTGRAAVTPPSYYPDVQGAAREAGMGPGVPGAGVPQAGGQPFNPLQALSDLFSRGPGAFMQDLNQLNQQAGPAYAPQPRPPAPVPPSAAAPAAAPTARPDQMPPGSAARAATEGARRAAAGEAYRPGEKAPLVLRDPSDPSKGFMPDPNYQRQQEATAPTGNRAADEGKNSPTGATEPQTTPAPKGSGQNWWGTRPPDYFQHHGGAVGANLETINTPYGRVTANRQVAQDFEGLTNDMKEAGVPGITKFGSFNPRPKRYGSGYSSHAYGSAFDINDQPGAMNPQTQGWINQHPQEWQDMLRRHNFVQYMPQKDPNHLEWAGPGAGQNPTYAAGAKTDRRQLRMASRGDRNNNPGNIKMGPDARQYGATGVDDQGHAIFPNWEAGAQAQASLLRNRYNHMSVPQMFNHGRGYAQDPGWPRGVMQYGGFGPHEILNLDDPATLDRLQRAIWRQEGTHPPTGQQAQTQMPIQLAGEINPDIANMVEQRNRELENDRRRNAILAGRPTIEEGSNRGGSHVPNRPFHPSDIDEFIHRNIGSLVNAVPIGRILGGLRSSVQPTTVGRDEDVR